MYESALRFRVEAESWENEMNARPQANKVVCICID